MHCDRGPVALRFGCGSPALYYNPAKSSRAARIFRWHGRPLQSASNSSLPIPLPQIPLPNSTLLAAAPSRAAIPISPVPPRLERAPRDHRVGILRRSLPPSPSAFLPISAVFHSAPPPSGRFLETPQRSERTQRRRGRKRPRREDFPRSAAVCAEHQPQQLGRMRCLRFQRVPLRIRGRCGWSSTDTAALLRWGSPALCSSHLGGHLRICNCEAPTYCRAIFGRPPRRMYF